MRDGKYWVRHSRNGLTGWLVKAGTTDVLNGPEPGAEVLIHAPGNSQWRPFSDGTWVAMDDTPKLPIGSKVSVAYKAIQEYARITGDYAASTKDLSSFKDEVRIAIFRDGASAIPGRIGSNPAARRIWKAIMRELEDA